eukprot:scaffold4060_cov121-Cylindrotheca_fusiformis.AAC.4
MGRRKIIQPKRIIANEELPKNKRRRFQNDNETTSIIPADTSDPFLSQIPNFVKAFHAKLQSLAAEYIQATRDEKDANGWYRGYRLITGNRFEVKVMSDVIVKDFAEYLNPVDLIRYAERQAMKDTRITQSIPNPVFSDWSIIVSEDCDAQPIHIDVPLNNFQFGMILQDNTKGTMVLQKHIGPDSPEDLIRNAWKDAPQPIKDCIQHNESVKRRIQNLLDAYGPLLWPRERIDSGMVGCETLKPQLQCGDLICTCGGIPHAGPACDQFRMVVFAAVSPTRESLYNVDDQYFAHSSILFAVQILWDHINAASKRWLLNRLAKTVHDYEKTSIENHSYVSGPFTKLMHKMAEAQKRESAGSPTIVDQEVGKEIDKFMETFGGKSAEEMFQYQPPAVWNHIAGSL